MSEIYIIVMNINVRLISTRDAYKPTYKLKTHPKERKNRRQQS